MSNGGPIKGSHICEDVYREGLENKETLLKVLQEVGEQHHDKKLIIFGCGDWYVRMIIENKELLSQYYVIPYIDEELMNQIVLNFTKFLLSLIFPIRILSYMTAKKKRR